MTDFSVLDLVPVREGGSVGDALAAATALARTAQDAGCKRFWVAEHHAMKGIAGGATSVVLAHIGNATSTIRIGSGGIMLPNHSPFQIAEQFGTLDALFPGRIDLGLGRAPGAGPELQRALRKDLHRAAEMFPQDVAELIALMAGETAVQPTPGVGAKPQFWMLGSSLFGAQLAAKLGLPYAFASHFAPGEMMRALDIYRQTFRASPHLEKPYVMLGYNAFVAETDEAARLLFTTVQQAFVNLRTGRPGKLPPPLEGYYERLDGAARGMIDAALACSAVGAPATAKAALDAFIAQTDADELMLTSQIWDPAARVRSLELLAAATGLASA